ncbi:diacylglycerol kinase family lipid kinase, partial [bacterium]|nr:diacylglycerol kinase family lipid kinase [bacterium]
KKPLKKTFFICNPAAGAGLAHERWSTLYDELIAHNVEFDYQFTTMPKNATKIVNDVIERGYNRIAVFGGDGTVNEVLQGIMANGKAPDHLELILIPAGSSCDFAKKYPNSKSNIELILSEEIFAVDIGKIECNDKTGNPVTNYFINNSSIGVISLANEKYNNVRGLSKQIKRWSVDAAAIIAGIKAIGQFKPISCELQFDDEEVYFTEITNITVFKTPYFGGGMYYNVETQQDDGNLTVALVDRTSKLKLLGLIPALYAGTALNKKPAHHRNCTTLNFDTNRNFYIEMDGESAGYPPAKYSILKQAINIVI